MFNYDSITKEELINIIKSSKSMELAALRIGIDRRTLLRLREYHGIVNTQVNISTIKEQLELDFTEKKTSNYELSDILSVISSLSKNEAKDILSSLNEKAVEEEVNENLETVYSGRFKEKTDRTHREYRKFVIISVQNDTQVDEVFYKTLKSYCSKHSAKLLITPVYYKFNNLSKFNVDKQDLFTDNSQLSKHLKLLTELKINPTIVDPFAGLDGLSKGDTIIIPHPQVSMKTMATLGDSPAQMYTTGSLSLKDGIYENTKTGAKAEFNHSNAALIVELGNSDSFHIRSLNCDEKHGFYDIDGYYLKDKFTELTHIEAIYLGDTHATVADKEVIKATFLNENSIVKTLKPKTIIHGDLFDAQSVSHHDNHDYLVRVGKSLTGKNNVEVELKEVANFLLKTTPENTKVLINASNHNDHLYKWLTTQDPHNDLVNAKMYHYLNYLMISQVENSLSGPKYPNLLELWFENSDYSKVLDFSEFLGRKSGCKIKDIEISMHGDKGINGAKGSPASFSRLPFKNIVGHSHSPSIRLGCYTVGTSSMKDLSYTGGPSSWMHNHCIIYPNGKRQMINIINGKWNNI